MAITGVVRGEHKPPRVVLYGPPGIGKTTFGADSPSPIFIATEDGAGPALSVDQLPVSSWAEVVGRVNEIATDEDDAYRTVVVDTLNGAADLCAAHVCAEQFGGKWGVGGFDSYGQGWAAVSREIIQLLIALDKCRERGLTVVLLAHTGVTNVKNPAMGDFQKFTPDLNKNVWAKVHAWSDIIMRADFDFARIKGKDGKVEVKSDSTRVVIASGSAVEDAKTRVGYALPERFPLAWSSFAEHVGRKNGTGASIAKLWDLLDSESAIKTLAYLGVQTINDIENADANKAKVVLNKLKEKERNHAQ